MSKRECPMYGCDGDLEIYEDNKSLRCSECGAIFILQKKKGEKIWQINQKRKVLWKK